MSNEVKSVLNLDKIVFDKIEFNRLGFSSEKAFNFELKSYIAQRQDEEIYKATLVLKGTKEEEYTIEISVSGFFSFDSNEELNDETKNELISKNTIAILMPYLRSEVSLLTAQPNVECVVLPTFNINNMIEHK